MKNMIVTCSRLLIVVTSIDLFFRYFRVLHRMADNNADQYQNFSSGKHSPHLVRHASPGTVQLYNVGSTCLIRISNLKSLGDFSMLERRLVSSHMDLVMLNFSFEFHIILWDFDK